MAVSLPAVDFGAPEPGTVVDPAGLATFAYASTLSTTGSRSVTVATTERPGGDGPRLVRRHPPVHDHGLIP